MNYYTPRQFTTTFSGTEIRYYSKLGLPGWDSIPPALMLLAEHATPSHRDQVLCSNCGSGALAVYLAKMIPEGNCQVSSFDSLALTCSALSLAENNIHNMHIISEIEQDLSENNCDLILLNIHKGRNLNRRAILEAWEILKIGGRLLIAGANDQGIQSVIKDAAQIFPDTSVLAYKKGNRVAQCIKRDKQLNNFPEWVSTPGIAPGTWHFFQLELDDRLLNLVSLPGVFSYTGLDDGTRLLISSMRNLSGKSVLDVGCGFGIIGLCAAEHGATMVDMVDNNLLAVASSRENIARNQYKNCRVYCSDILSAVTNKKFDYIISNPPFHAGMQVDYQPARALIAGAPGVLTTGGYLQLVANRFIPYDRLMADTFGNVAVLAQTPAYHILVSQKEKV